MRRESEANTPATAAKVGNTMAASPVPPSLSWGGFSKRAVSTGSSVSSGVEDEEAKGLCSRELEGRMLGTSRGLGEVVGAWLGSCRRGPESEVAHFSWAEERGASPHTGRLAYSPATRRTNGSLGNKI